MTHILRRALAYWLPLLVVITGTMGFAAVAVQQNYRQNMNDPQIKMAEHIASALSGGEVPAAFVSRGVPPVDIATSLDTWVTIYDSSGQPLESDAVLEGAPPRLPGGLLDTGTWVPHKRWDAPSGPETRVTWQPRPAIRQALVLVRYDLPVVDGVPEQYGYVAAGRSMRLTEERIIGLMQQASVAWSTTALGTLVVIIFLLTLGWL